MTEKRLKVNGDGPNWTALVRRADRQVMVAFVGTNEASLGMVETFLRAAGNQVPRSDLILVELNANFQVVTATDIWARFKLFEAKRAVERAPDDWIRKGS